MHKTRTRLSGKEKAAVRALTDFIDARTIIAGDEGTLTEQHKTANTQIQATFPMLLGETATRDGLKEFVSEAPDQVKLTLVNALKDIQDGGEEGFQETMERANEIRAGNPGLDPKTTVEIPGFSRMIILKKIHTSAGGNPDDFLPGVITVDKVLGSQNIL
ncbi:MAG: hypothetical protein ABH851_04580 [Methanobacteriota archaeon]